MVRGALFLVFAVLPLWLPASGAGEARPEQLARQTATQFVKALKARDLDGMVKVIDVPWLGSKGQIIKDAAELTMYLKARIEGIKDPNGLPEGVLKVVPYLGAPDQATKEEREAADQVMGKEGWVVVLARDGRRAGSILVRVKDGQARVVGIGG